MMPIEDIKHEIEQCKKHIARIEGWIAEPCMSASIAKNEKALLREQTLLLNLEVNLAAVEKLMSDIVTRDNALELREVNDELVPPDFSHMLPDVPEHSIAFVGGPLDGEHCSNDCWQVDQGIYKGPHNSVYGLKWCDRVFMYAGVMDE